MLNLGTLKSNIQTILEAANTTTGSPVDLSAGLETRVQRVLTVNPSRIPIQASFYPYVTIFIDRKEVELKSISKTQTAGKRLAEIDVKVVGAVWNSTVTDEEADPADNDAEKLMESVEEILRANSDLGGAALWSFPTLITYHNLTLEEDAHIRAGILNLKTSVYY
jgi:hypothetical protein